MAVHTAKLNILEDHAEVALSELALPVFSQIVFCVETKGICETSKVVAETAKLAAHTARTSLWRRRHDLSLHHIPHGSSQANHPGSKLRRQAHLVGPLHRHRAEVAPLYWQRGVEGISPDIVELEMVRLKQATLCKSLTKHNRPPLNIPGDYAR